MSWLGRLFHKTPRPGGESTNMKVETVETVGTTGMAGSCSLDAPLLAGLPTGLRVELCRAGAKLPVRSTPGSAGLDLYYPGPGAIRILPGDHTTIPLGIKLSMPAGMVGLICPRSGMAVKQGVTVLNAPGVVDGDYRGEIHAVLINLGKEPFQVTPGDRVAQLLLVSSHALAAMQVVSLDVTARGEGGFGSTGR